MKSHFSGKPIGEILSSRMPMPPLDPGHVSIQPVQPPVSHVSNGMVFLPVEKIGPNPFQPRKHFDQHKIEELATSIRMHGILQPVIVTRHNGAYQLVVGERRWRAARSAGVIEIPAIVKEFAQADGLQAALIENIQREDLNPLEEAAAFQFLIREHALKQEELALRVGKSRSSVANTLRLLGLPQAIQGDLRSGVLSAGHARALLSLTNISLRERVWRRVRGHHLSVRQTEAYVRSLQEGAEKLKKRKRRRLPTEWLDVQEHLQRQLSAQVRIRPQNKTAGKIEIHYTSMDELDRLVEALARKRSSRYAMRMEEELL